jgi:hypothetical protein
MNKSISKTGVMETKTGTTKVSFDFIIKDLEDKEIGSGDNAAHAGKMIARIFAGMTKGDIYKLMEWAKKCYHGVAIEFNAKEKKDFQEYIEQTEQLTVLSKVQILDVLNAA